MFVSLFVLGSDGEAFSEKKQNQIHVYLRNKTTGPLHYTMVQTYILLRALDLTWKIRATYPFLQ